MAEDRTTGDPGTSRGFHRRIIDVHEIFHTSLARHLVGGSIADKQELEKDKLKISAGLVNNVVAGGVLRYRSQEKKTDADRVPETAEEASGEQAINEASLFRLLENTIFMMLNQLNQPDVNLLKISLSKPFRQRLEEIFSPGLSGDAGRFPVKIFHDVHPSGGGYIGINMRNIRSLGEDLNRIERDELLKRELTELRRPIRHTDGNLLVMFNPITP
ncbi:MAG: hypothetical protein U9P14_04470 [Gemmatimonadota bacterium]|nr:hypothetical protein [Gemmatimonadota bacterium]